MLTRNKHSTKRGFASHNKNSQKSKGSEPRIIFFDIFILDLSEIQSFCYTMRENVFLYPLIDIYASLHQILSTSFVEGNPNISSFEEKRDIPRT